MTRGRAAVLVALAAATWGTTGTSQAIAVRAGLAASPASVGAARVVAGAIVLAAVAAVDARRRGQERVVLPRAPLLVAGVAIAAYQVLFFAGVDLAGVAVGTVVGIGSAPVLTGLVAWLADRTTPSRAWWVATLLAVVGCALVLTPTRDVATSVPGVLLALGAGLSYAVVTVAGRRVLDAGVRPTAAMAAIFAVGALPGLGLLAVEGVGDLASRPGVGLVAWLAVVTVAVGYVLYGRGLRELPPATVGTLTLAEPLVAALLGVALLGERPAGSAAVGAALLACGLVVVGRDGARTDELAPAS